VAARRRGIAGCDSIRIAAHLRRASKGVAHRRSYCVGEVGAERSTPDVQIENFGEGDLTENQRKEARYAQKQLADSFFAACLLIGFGAAYPGDGARADWSDTSYRRSREISKGECRLRYWQVGA